MVPPMYADIARVEEAQAEAPALLGPRQPDQQIGDLLVIVVQLGGIAIACLADTKGAAGERGAHPTQRHCFRGYPPADRQCSHCRQAPGVEMAASLFSKSLFEQFRLHAHLRIHLLQATVLVFQSLHLADHLGIHAAVFGSPFVERRSAHSMCPA